MEYIESANQVADIFTKPVDINTFRKLVPRLNLIDQDKIKEKYQNN